MKDRVSEHSQVGFGRALALLAMTYAVLGCAATDSQSNQTSSVDFPDIETAMVDHMAPTVDELIPKELNKDDEAIDFRAIAEATDLARRVFIEVAKTGSPLWAKSKLTRKHATKTATWFATLQQSAEEKNKAKLLRTFLTKRQICSTCHDYDD